jgi:hypothetical protein
MSDEVGYTKADEFAYWLAVEDKLYELWINDPPQPRPSKIVEEVF